MRTTVVLLAGSLLTGSLLAGCGAVPAQPESRTPQQQEHFSRLIGNRVPGPPASCVPSWYQSDMATVDGRTLVFGGGSGQVSVVSLSEGCQMLGRPNSTLQTTNYGAGLCTGDIARVIDPSNGMFIGSCVVRSVTPYARPGR